MEGFGDPKGCCIHWPCPIRIVPQHGGGNAESKENVVIAPLGIGNRLCWPVVVGPRGRVEVSFTCPLENVRTSDINPSRNDGAESGVRVE
jgi:hypothetical protein